MLFPRALTVVSLLACSTAFATNPIDIETYLKKFHQDPVTVMNDHLAIRDEFGFVLPEDKDLWPKDEKENQAQVDMKAQLRSKICHADASGHCIKPFKIDTFAAYPLKEELTNLLYTPNIVRNLQQLDNMGIQLSMTTQEPWSESYWPVHQGGMARRYADPGFPSSTTWATNYAYYLAVPPAAVPVNQKAPAEKYDLLVGDFAYNLTHSLWVEGQQYMTQYGTVPTWVGYCHGWSPASFMYPEPVRNVTVTATDGTPITFHPSDVRALASLSWGQAPPPVGFIGTVCKKSSVKTDPENGRILDPECFDVNPGSWHIALMNQIGILKRSMVMDATWNREIWNFPISGYHIRYFNPQTLKESATLGGAMVPFSQFTLDKFKKYRAPQAVYAVGIALDIGYSAETQPTISEGHREPVRKVVRWLYDLELNAAGDIIGGEWYSNQHADFVWNPFPVDKFPNRQPLSLPEIEYLKAHPALPSWSGVGPITGDLVRMAPQASSNQQPLHVIVDKLVQMSVSQ